MARSWGWTGGLRMGWKVAQCLWDTWSQKHHLPSAGLCSSQGPDISYEGRQLLGSRDQGPEALGQQWTVPANLAPLQHLLEGTSPLTEPGCPAGMGDVGKVIKTAFS